jgi:hypothetical protein
VQPVITAIIVFCVGGSKERRQTILIIQHCFFNSCDANCAVSYSTAHTEQCCSQYGQLLLGTTVCAALCSKDASHCG